MAILIKLFWRMGLNQFRHATNKTKAIYSVSLVVGVIFLTFFFFFSFPALHRRLSVLRCRQRLD